MKTLKEKVEASIALIQRGEGLALALNPNDGYFVGFSGGKDSQVLMELVKRAGVRYRAYYSVTTNDPPDNVYFIRHHYPNVVFLHHHPNLYAQIAKKGLPTIFHRWCCEIYKEKAGAGNVVLTGIRREESKKRAKYPQIDVRSDRKEHKNRTTPYSIEEFEEAEHQCIKGKDKIMIYPLLEWTATDIWVFIAQNHLPINPCYETSGRVGCMFCPYVSKEQIEYYEKTQPKAFALVLNNLEKYIVRDGVWRDKDFSTTTDYWEWWKSGKKLKDFKAKKTQTTLNFEEEGAYRQEGGTQ